VRDLHLSPRPAMAAGAPGGECRVPRPILASPVFVGEEVAKGATVPKLTSAKIIVSGRAAPMAEPGEFCKIYRAGSPTSFGAGVGASARRGPMPATPPNDWQVGPDRQGGGAGTLCRDRHLRRDSSISPA